MSDEINLNEFKVEKLNFCEVPGGCELANFDRCRVQQECLGQAAISLVTTVANGGLVEQGVGSSTSIETVSHREAIRRATPDVTPPEEVDRIIANHQKSPIPIFPRRSSFPPRKRYTLSIRSLGRR